MKSTIGFTKVALVAVAAAFFLQPSGTGALAASPTGTDPAPRVRMKWQDFIKGPAGAKRLASLQKAVTKMKSLNTSTNKVDYMRSWEYWANIHGYYGPKSMDGTVAGIVAYLKANNLGQYVSYFDGIKDQQLPQDGVADKVWATCQHSSGPGADQANFWGWHRMYLYYFERVLRWAAQDETLTLPYWDYTDPAQTALPAEFRDVKSVLYDAKRDPQKNNGTQKLDPDTTNADAALKESDYLTAEFDVEEGVHGNVHCETAVTCPIAHMGDVPVAANDPIFYVHHANIDRLWACWQKSYPAPPSAPWQTQKFSFPDETGTLRTRPVSDFLSTATLGYVYDNVDHCLRTAAARPVITTSLLLSQKMEDNFPVLVASAQAVALTQPKTSVDIALPQQALQTMAQAATKVSTRLVLQQIRAQSPPGAQLKVYVEAKGKPAQRKYVATISWFNAFGPHHPGPDVRTLTFDVSDQLKALGVTTGTAGLTVTFEAASGSVPMTPPTGAALTATAAAFRPEAKLTIGAVQLRQAKTP